MKDYYFTSVGAIVLRENKVLLVRHTYGSAVGKLLNPGGFIKLGEMPYEAIKREVLEETGVIINPIGMLSLRCSQKDWYLVFLAEYVSGEPRTDNAENSEAFFMDYTEVIQRSDATATVKILLQLALSYNPIIPKDAGEGRIMFASGKEL